MSCYHFAVNISLFSRAREFLQTANPLMKFLTRNFPNKCIFRAYSRISLDGRISGGKILLRRNDSRCVHTCSKRVPATQSAVAIRFNQSRIQRANGTIANSSAVGRFTAAFATEARSSTYACHYGQREDPYDR